MDYEQPIMLRLLASAKVVASRAGAEVRRIMKTGQLGVVDKGIQDFQTEADRLAQRMIVASLAKRFPKCTIVGEEDLVEDEGADADLVVDSYDEDILKLSLPADYRTVKEEDITIWVDPLDGTTEFVKGFLEHVTVLIGISVDGRSVAGVIHQPFYGHSQSPPNSEGRTIWGLVGLGCFGVESMPLPEDRLIITTTASHGSINIEESIEAIKPDEVLRVGGAGYKVLMVIEGKAHSYLFSSFGCKRWDTSAPEAILKSLGGVMTDVFGKPIEYNADGDYHNHLGNVASASPDIHSKVLKKIPIETLLRLRVTMRQKLEGTYESSDE